MHSDPEKYRELLRTKTKDELNVIAKQLNIPSFRKLNRESLIQRIVQNPQKDNVAGSAFSSWWSRHHNHVYGTATVIGLALTVAFFLIQNSRNSSPPSISDGDRTSGNQFGGTVSPNPEARIAAEAQLFSPVSVDDFFKTVFDWNITQIQRDDFLARQIGRRVIWEGSVADAFESSGEATLVIRSETLRDRFAFFTFPAGYRADLLLLKRDQKVKVCGILKEWNVTHVNLEKAQLFKVSP